MVRDILRSALCMCALGFGMNMFAAGPSIQFDAEIAQVGSIAEGSVSEIKHEYHYTNTGDATLKLTDVRPGCGCTLVRFDTVIAPGKTGVLTARVNITALSNGHFSKSITVLSNASNKPTARLEISGTFAPYVAATPEYIRIVNNKEATVITMTTTLASFEVKKITFKPTTRNGAATDVVAWQVPLPVFVNFKQTMVDSTKTSDSHMYKIELSSDVSQTQEIEGLFIIQTNHPHKEELSIRGKIYPQ